MRRTLCALCLRSNKLRKSHIIPNAAFRRIKHHSGGGQLVYFDDNPESKIRRSQESWHERLLCSGCETIIASYEKTGLDILRGVFPHQSTEHADGFILSPHDYQTFKLFLVSLLWRAAVSTQAPFAKVEVPSYCAEQARIALLRRRTMHSRRLGCKIARLTDPTPSERGGFSIESLRQLIVSPIPRLDEKSEHYSFLFILEGYALELFAPRIPLHLADQPGVHKNLSTMFVPLASIFEIPELLALMVSAYGKNEQGKATVETRRR